MRDKDVIEQLKSSLEHPTHSVELESEQMFLVHEALITELAVYQGQLKLAKKHEDQRAEHGTKQLIRKYQELVELFNL